MVSFNNIQPYWKLPGPSIEVDPSQAGTPVNPKYGLLVGIAKGGTAPFDTPVAVGTQTDANAFFRALAPCWLACSRSGFR
jgi:phage tail sheath gpL-like